jgi:hypothetical protein
VTFTRSGNTATVVNSSGYVAPINADLPRFDYDPVTLACKGLLIEESRSNLVRYSSDFSNALWSKTATTIGGTAITAPDGTVTANKLIATAVTSNHFIFQTVVALSATQYAISFYVKKGEYDYVRIENGATGLGAYYNVATGQVVSGSGASIFAAGNGWYRCIYIATTGAATLLALIAPSINGTTINFTGDGTSGVYVWGAQAELGVFPTSYIPTIATSVTRNADVAVMTSTNFSSWYTATTGAAVVWAIPQAVTGTRPLIQFDDTTANEIITLRGNVADPEMSIVDGGVAQAQIDTGTIVANTAYKLSGAWNTDSCAAAQNGAAAVTDNTATIPTPTQLRIGSDGTNYASAIIQKVLYYPQRIIDAEVQAISK